MTTSMQRDSRTCIDVTESMFSMNRTTSMPKSVVRYDVDKGQNIVIRYKVYEKNSTQEPG